MGFQDLYGGSVWFQYHFKGQYGFEDLYEVELVWFWFQIRFWEQFHERYVMLIIFSWRALWIWEAVESCVVLNNPLLKLLYNLLIMLQYVTHELLIYLFRRYNCFLWLCSFIRLPKHLLGVIGDLP